MLALLLLPVAVWAWSCPLQITGQNGIGLYQDNLYNQGKNTLLWKVFSSKIPGTTFFYPLPSDMYITIFVGSQFGWSESGKVLAAPGTAFSGSVDQGLIKGPNNAGACTDTTGCIRVTINTDQGFGNPVWIRLYKGDAFVSNYSLPLPGSAVFQMDLENLYLVGFQEQAGVPVTDQMRQSAYRVDLSSHCVNGQPLVIKVLSIPTAPYLYFERPQLDPYGSRCLASSGPSCVSVTFNGTWSPMQVAVFAKDRQWLRSKPEAYRPIVWQKLRTDLSGPNFTFPFDDTLSVGVLVFMTDPIDYGKYILASPLPAKLGQTFKATLDAQGMPQLAPLGTSTTQDIQISTQTSWFPSFKNTQMVVMKNGVPIGSSGIMLSAQTWVFDIDQSTVFFKGDNQFDLYGKIMDFDIDRATGFVVYPRASKFLGVYVDPTNVMVEYFATDQCRTAYCGNGKCNNITGACDCNPGWKGMMCNYALASCVGVDCGVHGYCTVSGASWQCNCVDQWIGTHCELPPGATLSPTRRPTSPVQPSQPTSLPQPTPLPQPTSPTQPTTPTLRPTADPTPEPPCVIPPNPADKSPSTTAATVVVSGSVFFLVLPHWSLWLLWNQLQTLSLTVNVDSFPDRYKAYMSRLAILNFQGWGWLDKGDNRQAVELQPEYPCTPGCCLIGAWDAAQNSSSLDVHWTAIDQLPPTCLHVAVALGAAFLLGALIVLGTWIFAKCTVSGQELRAKHSKTIPLLPFSLCFRVVSLAYLSLNYAVYQHLVWFRAVDSAWTAAAWAILTCNVGLLGAYILVPHKHNPSYEFVMASVYLDARTNSKLRGVNKRTLKQQCALFWPFVGILHNHLFGVVVATLQPQRTSVSFVNMVDHATESSKAMAMLVGLSLSQIIVFAMVRPYDSRFKTRITLFSQFCSCLCLVLLWAYSLQESLTPETAPMTVLVLNTVGSIISFVLLAIQSFRELVGDDELRARFPWFFRKEEASPLLAQQE